MIAPTKLRIEDEHLNNSGETRAKLATEEAPVLTVPEEARPVWYMMTTNCNAWILAFDSVQLPGLV